jgi:Osmosensitive K+ channel histidine kinase
MESSWLRAHLGVARLLAVVVPLLVAASLQPALAVITNAAAGLVLVLAVVAAATIGDRPSGALAALSAGLGFDLFLTEPHFQLRIDDPQDIEVTILLLIVGLAVSELASWGIRRSLEANRQLGFVDDALEASALAAGSVSAVDGLERTSAGIQRVLAADAVVFTRGDHGADALVVHPDGTLRRHGAVVDLARRGHPHGAYGYCAIPIARQGAQVGFFRVDLPEAARPTREQLRVASLLAGQWALRVEPLGWAREHPGQAPSG